MPPDAPAPEIPWDPEARQRVERAPAFVRPGILKLMARRAVERGRDRITSEFLTEIRNESMLRAARSIRGMGFEELSMGAFDVARRKMRKLPRKLAVLGEIQRFLAARTIRNEAILQKFQEYLRNVPARGFSWTDEARARAGRIPEAFRPLACQAAEVEARRRKEHVITPEIVDAVLAVWSGKTAGSPADDVPAMPWTPEACARVERIPVPPVRRRVRERAEAAARGRGEAAVSLESYESVLEWRGPGGGP
jgi:hypothetical protein